MPAASEADTRSVEARGAEKSHRRGAASSVSDQVRGVTGRMGGGMEAFQGEHSEHTGPLGCERTQKYGHCKSSQTEWWHPSMSNWGKGAENETRGFGVAHREQPCSLRGL